MSNYTVFMDLDGVLVDFIRGMCRAHKKINPYRGVAPPLESWELADLWNLTPEEFWKPGNEESFWSELDWTSDGKEILHVAERIAGPENIYLLTSPSLSPSCAAGKMAWVQTEMPNYARRLLIGACKPAVAGPTKILIDDFDSNCKKFHEAGGHVIVAPRPWNSNGMIPDTASHIAQVLRNNVQMLGSRSKWD